MKFRLTVVTAPTAAASLVDVVPSFSVNVTSLAASAATSCSISAGTASLGKLYMTVIVAESAWRRCRCRTVTSLHSAETVPPEVVVAAEGAANVATPVSPSAVQLKAMVVVV